MYEKILVPVDGSPTSLQGLREAIQISKLSGGRMKLLHVVDDLSFMTSLEAGVMVTADILQLMREAGEKLLGEALAEVRAAGLDADTQLIESWSGRVSDVVVAQARDWGARLIVLGTHGRRGVGRMLLGSDAEQIARLAPVPVLLVRGQP
ncbi:universal stress protein [Alicycliphilus denitrificans]|uniref:universal stress protein n=1 Tax=Alicycliphilus denitrificans TaxID=179636 RepID=UPI003850DFB1